MKRFGMFALVIGLAMLTTPVSADEEAVEPNYYVEHPIHEPTGVPVEDLAELILDDAGIGATKITLWFPPGTYTLTEPIRVPTGVTVRMVNWLLDCTAELNLQSVGRMFTIEAGGRLVLEHGSFQSIETAASSTYGGLIYLDDAELRLGSCGDIEIKGGKAQSNGGCIFAVDSEISGWQVTFEDCEADGRGGAVYSDNTDMNFLEGVDFVGNDAGVEGGGMYMNGGTVLVRGGDLRSNTANNSGSAIFAEGGSLTLTADDGEPSFVHLNESFGGGAAVVADDAQVQVWNTQLKENSGGAMHLLGTAGLDVENSLIAQHESQLAGSSSTAMRVGAGATVNVDMSTFADNDVHLAIDAGANVTVNGSILWGDYDPLAVTGPLEGVYNIANEPTWFTIAGLQMSVDPQFSTLASSALYEVAPTSPAVTSPVNAGSTLTNRIDLAGRNRPSLTTRGAYQVNPIPGP